MKIPMYQVDAFTFNLFEGNPAAVCPLEHWLDEKTMQLIARENNLSETAFIVPHGTSYQIRWFTPNTEVDLCGHATLASAFVLFELLGYQKKQLTFTSKSGLLTVRKEADLFRMDFPALRFDKIEPSQELIDALTIKPDELYQSTLIF